MSVPAMHLRTRPNLQQLLHGYAAAPPIDIEGIASDSRLLAPGFLFLACAGGRVHGVDYATQALDKGVAAIVYDADTAEMPPLETPVPVIAVGGLQHALGDIANRWFGTPSSALRVTGVTGTNGKTTVACMLAQCLNRLGRRTAYAGTIGQGIDKIEAGSGLTTSSCVELHRSLAQFLEAGAVSAAIEVSSHALQQRRVDGVQFESVLFTNLSRDHIDYHGSMERYFEEKRKLFTAAAPRHCVINVDSVFGRRLARDCSGELLAVTSEPNAEWRQGRFLAVTNVEAENDGSLVEFDSSWGVGRYRLPVPGRFNVDNASLVLAELLRQGYSVTEACDALSAVSAPPGRMQRVEAGPAGELPEVIVDYAHTPDGLRAVLEALRPHCAGRLWCVFGCGGDRDSGKRPQMGKTAAELADVVVVTSDNPRSEDPAAIIREITDAIADDNVVAIENRAEAIAYAISAAAVGDTVVIAGKGHESVQLIGDRVIPFSDFEVARDQLLARSQGAVS